MSISVHLLRKQKRSRYFNKELSDAVVLLAWIVLYGSTFLTLLDL